jgi:hypothetical protein
MTYEYGVYLCNISKEYMNGMYNSFEMLGILFQASEYLGVNLDPEFLTEEKMGYYCYNLGFEIKTSAIKNQIIGYYSVPNEKKGKFRRLFKSFFKKLSKN